MIAPKNEAERILLSYIDEHKDTLYETLSSLVRIDTQNERSHGNENAGQEHLAALCADICPDALRRVLQNPRVEVR
jgi:hypothetical protein